MVFRRKPRADLDVKFETGKTSGDMAAFLPGEVVKGMATVTPEKDVQAKRVAIQLVWYTEGRGDRDMGIIEELPGGGGLLTAGMPISQGFQFTLPMEPWSFSGELVNIVWAIRVVIEPDKGKPGTYEYDFIMSPAGQPLEPPAAVTSGR